MFRKNKSNYRYTGELQEQNDVQETWTVVFIEGYGAHQERIKAQKTQKLSPFHESIPKKSPFRESNLKPTAQL